MRIGFIGLGRMGFNMCLNLLGKGHELVVNDLNHELISKLEKSGAEGARSIAELVAKLPNQKIVWLMVPAKEGVDNVLQQLVPLLNKNSIIIDGGNSYFEDSVKRGKELQLQGIHFLDCGTSGGIEGSRNGACMMVGGDREIFRIVEPLIRDMCVPDGYGYMGKSGAGHFAKMVHNGIEYGMMGAIAEGVQVLKESAFHMDLKEVVKVYSHGSIIESRLMSWLNKSFQIEGYLKEISGEVPEGETEEKMKKLETIARMPILHQARIMREQTRKRQSFAGKLIAAMRNQFGGHAVNQEML